MKPNAELFSSAHTAGLKLYGEPRDYENDGFGPSGLVWDPDDIKIIRLDLSYILDLDDDEGDEACPTVDTFEYQFYPSSNDGADVAEEEIRTLVPDNDGYIYLYCPGCGIRIIDAKS